MPYTKQTWAKGSTGGTPVNDVRMNYIENGIATAQTTAETAATTATTASTTATAASTAAAAAQASADAVFARAAKSNEYPFSMAGALQVGVSDLAYRPGAGVLKNFKAQVSSAPAGAPLVLDILKNDVSVFTTKPTIADGSRFVETALNVTLVDADEIKAAVVSTGLPDQSSWSLGPTGATYSSGTSTTKFPTLPIPVGYQPGQLFLGFLALVGGTTATVATPTGWTLTSRTDLGSSTTLFIYNKVAAAGEAATVFNITDGASRPAVGFIQAVSTGQLDAIGAAASTSGGGSTTASAPSIATTVDSDLVYQVYASTISSAVGVLTYPTDTSPASNGRVAYASTSRVPTAGGAAVNNIHLAVYRLTAGNAGTVAQRDVSLPLAAVNIGQQIAVKNGNGGAPGSGLVVQLRHEAA